MVPLENGLSLIHLSCTLRLIQLLAEELAREVGTEIKANQSYAVWSPESAFATADVMLAALANEDRP
jgi:hypothetical protein